MTVTQVNDAPGGNALSKSIHSTLSEHGRDEDTEKIAQCTTSQAAFNTFFYMFAAVQVPYAVAQAGWAWGIAILLTLSAISTHSGFVLAELCTEKKAYTWKDIGQVSCGPKAKVAIECLQIFSIFFTSMIQTGGAGSVWQAAFPTAPVCLWQWVVINAFPYLVFLQIPSFSGSTVMQIATYITLFGTVWRVAMYFISFIMWGAYPYKCYDGQDLSTIFNGAANLMGSFGVKVCCPEMVREMKNPREYAKAWGISQLVVVPLYIAVGLWGFALYGTFVNANNLFNNFKNVGAFSFYFILQPVLGMMPICYGQILLFLKAELHWGVLPCDWWTVSNPETNRFPGIPPVLFRLGFRSGVLAIWVFLALFFIGYPVGVLFSLFSAFSSAAFSFYLPYVFSLMCFGHEFGGMKKALYILAIVISVAFSGIGIYSSAQAMAGVGSSGPFEFEATCSSAGAFFLGQFDGSHYDAKGGGYSNATGPGTFHDTFYLGTCGDGGNIGCGQPGYGIAGGVCGWDKTEANVICSGTCDIKKNATLI